MLCTRFRRLSSRISRGVMSFFILCHNVNGTVPESCDSNNGTSVQSIVLCHWSDGVIPFAFNFFSLSPKRLRGLVQKGHAYLQERSCLVFKEYNPVELSKKKNFTHIFYNYSDVLESCCLPLFTKQHGRRMVLITPQCTLPAEIAHVTLHGMGFLHGRKEPFNKQALKQYLFKINCSNTEKKMKLFERSQQ